MRAACYPKHVHEKVEAAAGKMADDPAVIDLVKEYLGKDCDSALRHTKLDLNDLSAFWPPRLVHAFRAGHAAIFFGAGLSIPCKIPSWSELLGLFRIDQAIMDDDTLKYDPLTLAEISSKQIGHENLQDVLRRTVGSADRFSVTHALLAALRCPIYITTNYDCLFERAWQAVNQDEIPVIVNDADLARSEVEKALASRTGVLFKIHGSADRSEEQMILTRRDYRTHYRLNESFFRRVKSLMSLNQVLFLGFSHTDPEVWRLVEDIIYDYEHAAGAFSERGRAPHLFSLQFNMRSHTPEIFAARGIVALQPPPVRAQLADLRTQSLAVALSDLITRRCHGAAPATSLYDTIAQIRIELSTDIDSALDTLKSYTRSAGEFLSGASPDIAWLDNLQSELSGMASQGVYLADDQGNVVAHATPDTVPKGRRRIDQSVSSRPYFKQAKSFREAFVSDSSRSIFNRKSTFFFVVQ